MRKVAIYIVSDGVGGAEQVVWHSLSYLKNSNVTLFLITNDEMISHYSNVIENKNILNIGAIYIHRTKKYRLIRFLLNNRFYNIRKFLLRKKQNIISNFCAEKGIEIIHTHLDYAVFSAISLKTLFPKIKIIHTVHGAFGLVDDKLLKPDIPVRSLDFKKIDLLIFVANYLESLYREKEVVFNKSKVIYNGLIPTGVSRSRSFNKKNKFKILYVGGSKKVKGYDLVVSTVMLLKESGIENVIVDVLGTIDEKCELIGLIKEKKIERFFNLKGFVKPPDNFCFFLDNHLLFMPSRSEALPMAAIEAIFCNLPIVASNVGGLPEIIINGQNGYLCEPDPLGFKKSIENVYNNYTEFVLQTESFNTQHSLKFSLDKVNNELLKIYNTI